MRFGADAGLNGLILDEAKAMGAARCLRLLGNVERGRGGAGKGQEYPAQAHGKPEFESTDGVRY